MKLTKLLIAPLFIVMGINSEPMKGTTVGHYAKPGAPIDITYTTQSHKNNENNKLYDVNITLTTTVHNGIMKVQLNTGENLTSISSIEKEITFEITPKKRKYPINLQVLAKKDGLYYIRLLAKIDRGIGSKLRAFAVPVQIGKKIVKPDTIMMKSNSGENISISKAVETIKIAE